MDCTSGYQIITVIINEMNTHLLRTCEVEHNKNVHRYGILY